MREGFLGLVLLTLGCRAPSLSRPGEQSGPELGEAGAALDNPVDDSPVDAPPSMSGAAGEASADAAPSGCAAERITLDEFHSGRVRPARPVALGGLVASSQKFLLSEAQSGSCLWGAFAAGEGRSGAGSGLLLVSFGARHAEGEHCAPGADGLPDDLELGDGLDAIGTVDAYAPSSCSGVAPALQLRVDAACPLRRGPARAAPEPARIDAQLATQLAAGKDEAVARAWSGALVTLDDVSTVRDDADGDSVFDFGVIRLEQTPLELHSRVYYFDLSEGGPRSASKAPRFSHPWPFQRVTGIVLLDYCSWVLAPRERCRDLEPPSLDCARLPG